MKVMTGSGNLIKSRNTEKFGVWPKVTCELKRSSFKPSYLVHGQVFLWSSKRKSNSAHQFCLRTMSKNARYASLIVTVITYGSLVIKSKSTSVVLEQNNKQECKACLIGTEMTCWILTMTLSRGKASCRDCEQECIQLQKLRGKIVLWFLGTSPPVTNHTPMRNLPPLGPCWFHLSILANKHLL